MTHTQNLSVVLDRHLRPTIRILILAVDSCPDEVWEIKDGQPPVWQHALHATYYLQKWMRTPNDPFEPPAFVDLSAVNLEAPATPALDRATLREYLRSVSEQISTLSSRADDEMMLRPVQINGGTHTLLDQMLGQCRHVMYHVGCIAAIVRQYTGVPLPWIAYDTPDPDTPSPESHPNLRLGNERGQDRDNGA